MHPTATLFTELRTALAPQAGDNARPHFRARNALLALLFQQLDRLFASLERLFAAWQAGTLPPPPPPLPRTSMPRAALPRSARRRIWRLPQPAAPRYTIAASDTRAIIPAPPCQPPRAPAPRATPQHPIPWRAPPPRAPLPHHGPDPPHRRPPLLFSPPHPGAPPHAYNITIS